MLWFAQVGFEPTKPLDVEDVVDDLLDALPTGDGILPSMSGPGGGEPWTVRFCVEADTLKAATARAMTEFARSVHEGLPGTKVRTRFLELLDEAEFARRLAEPLIPALVGISEIAEQLGVSKPRARELVRDGRIRKVSDLASGPVCLAGDLEAYAATPRRAERPRKVVPGEPAAG
ncbi:helix-turn-helix domain-containing protein [Kineosporia sp. A_224]|uniref:helix-turn-helix domain-containing protein n=1 Tax=Kineosporia sp. A_224 TaxID=1962180 RepID=UPI000B4B2B61|nr:helix-turn-helix domain-containing protein [Kineosporia sp. A_224]